MTRFRFVRFALLSVAGIFAAVSVASAAGPFQFYSVTPCRVHDTRNTTRLARQIPRNITVKGLCGVPSNAQAAAFNVTAVAPTQGGFFTVWPYGSALPGVSTINFATGESAIANGAIVPLSSDPTLHISVVYEASSAGQFADVIFDVTGYFAAAP